MAQVYIVKVKLWKLVAQSCLTLCDSVDYSPRGSSVHGILQARVLEWVAIPFSRGSSQSRDWTRVSWIAGRFFTIWATREARGQWTLGMTIHFFSWFTYWNVSSSEVSEDLCISPTVGKDSLPTSHVDTNCCTFSILCGCLSAVC